MTLREELEKTARDLGHVIHETKVRTIVQGMDPYRALSSDGAPLLAPLLVARAHALAALAGLA